MYWFKAGMKWSPRDWITLRKLIYSLLPYFFFNWITIRIKFKMFSHQTHALTVSFRTKSDVHMCVMVHQMASFWTCGLVWLVSAWTQLSSSGWTRHLSPSPTGAQTNQFNQLRNPAVFSTLERYVHVSMCVWVHAFLCNPCVGSDCVLPRLCFCLLMITGVIL